MYVMYMHVCMYVCMYVYRLYMHACIHVCVHTYVIMQNHMDLNIYFGSHTVISIDL